MAMTNLNHNNQNDSNPKQQLTEPSPKQLPNGHYPNYTAANLSNLSPIYEGEIFASPTTTISPSISHNTIDNNHVVLFNHGLPKPNNESMAVSPTTSTSSSNSSNTPTPTTCNTANCHSNSLFNIPSTDNAHCIPSVGLMSANLSKTSTSSSSPSPSLDTTVSPVTKMDLFRDLKIFEEMDTETSHNNVTVDYLTGDTHCAYNEKPAKAAKANSHRVATTPVLNGCNVRCVTTDFPNIYNLPHSTKPMPEITVLNPSPVSNCNGNGNGHVPAPHSPLNSNSNDHKTHKKCAKMGKPAVNTSSKHQKSDKHRHRHCHTHRHHRSRKKKRKKSAENSYSDSDTELQKKAKLDEQIKNISILVPGDPNGLYKYWKRTKSHKKRPKHKKKPPRTHSQSQLDANTDAPFNLKNRDRMHSFPPNNHIYQKQSPRAHAQHLHTFHTLSSPSSSHSNSSSLGSALSVPIKICKSQSLSNLQDTQRSKAIIIHTPTNPNDENKAYNEYSFSVLGLRGRQHREMGTVAPNGYDLMSRVRMNTYPPYGNVTDKVHGTAPQISLIIERVSPSPGAHGCAEGKEEQWHYTSRTHHRQDNVAGAAECGKYGYYDYKKGNKVILREKWKDEEEDLEIASLPLECLSEPNASHIKGKRRRRKIAQSQKNLYNIHPSMPSFMKNSHSNHGKLYDL